MYQMDANAVGGLAEIYSTPADCFTAPTDFARLHPIQAQAALTDLEQDVEMELRRRGHKGTGVTKHLRSSKRYRAGNWVVKRLGYVPNTGDLARSVEAIADRLERENA